MIVTLNDKYHQPQHKYHQKGINLLQDNYYDQIKKSKSHQKNQLHQNPIPPKFINKLKNNKPVKFIKNTCKLSAEQHQQININQFQKIQNNKNQQNKITFKNNTHHHNFIINPQQQPTGDRSSKPTFIINPKNLQNQKQTILFPSNTKLFSSSNHTTKDNSRQKQFKQTRQTVNVQSSVCCYLLKSHREEEWKKVQNNQKVKNNNNNNNNSNFVQNNNSSEITKIVRIIMLDWIYELSAQIQLPKPSLYNCINYVDRYVILNNVKKKQYQTIGLACLFLATKLQTASHPKIQTFLEAMDNKIDRNALIQTQRKVAKSLKFKLNPPTIYQQITLLLFMIKSFKSLYKNISWIKDMPNIQKCTSLYRKIFWILDGLMLEGDMINKFDKDEICLSILYLSISEEKRKQFQLEEKRLNSTLYSSTSFQFSFYHSGYSRSNQKTIKDSFEKYIDRFNSNYQIFMSYATTSNKNIHSLISCMENLKKWTIYSCECLDQSTEYHEELKHLALRK